MSKQDRQGVRNATDLERKYQFGKSFAEVMGIARDAQTKADEAKQSIDDLTQEQIFNILTDNGKAEGVYRAEDGQIYINASYIKGGTLIADYIKLNETGYSASYCGSWDDLKHTVVDVADRMPVNTVKTFSLRMEVPEFSSFAILEIAVGLNADHMLEVIATLNAKGKEWVMTGESEDTYVDEDNPGEIFWGEWVAVGGSGESVEKNKLLYSGEIWTGNFTVPNTANYSLFAIKIGNGVEIRPGVILAYKYGNTIHGVGGWGGAGAELKAEYWVTITFDGDTWNLQNCSYNYVYGEGYISGTEGLAVREVIGVI